MNHSWTRKLIAFAGAGAMLAAGLLFHACGGGGAATQFDTQDLIDHSAQIQANADSAQIVAVVTVTSLGTAPAFWSGIAASTQPVTYTVDQVLKGTYTEASLVLNHLLVEGSRQAAAAPGLNPELFAAGAKLIVFFRLNTDYTSQGSDYSGPLYLDVDADYSAIPWSAQNQEVVASMIANPTAQSLGAAQVLADKGISPEKTLTVSGAEADVTSFNALLEACKARSVTLSNLVSQISNDATYDVTLNIVRDQASVFVDSFNGRKVDIKDLEDWYEGCNSKTDRCQLFGHILQEYLHAAVTGDGYAPSHASALDTENQIRRDLGKTTTLTGHWGVNKGGTWYMQTGYGDYTEQVELLGGSNVGGVTILVNPPAAPTNLAVNDATSCQLTITWTDNATDEAGYDIWRKDGASATWGPWWRDLPANATSYVNAHVDDPTLVLGETYCYRIHAWKSVDAEYIYSDWSNEACGVKH